MKTPRILLLVLLWQSGAAAAPDWQVNPADFEFSATMTAVLFVNASVAAGEDNLVGAFVGDECRGVASPMFTLETWMLFLTIYGHTSGETIRFRAYIAAEDVVVEVDEVIVFQANDDYGDPVFPFELHAFLEDEPPPPSPTISGIFDQNAETPDRFGLDQSFPNPFNGSTRIGYRLPAAGPAELAVYNLQGQKVRTLVSGWQPAGHLQVTWDGRDQQGRPAPSGVYVYAVRTGAFRAARKVLLVK